MGRLAQTLGTWMHMHIGSVQGVLVLVLTTTQTSVDAATIYRWTDDQGKTHYSEVVPDRYQKNAKPLVQDTSTPTPEQQREAQERAAKQKTQAEQAARPASKPSASASASPQSRPTPSISPKKRPTQVPNAQTDCETWVRLYKESSDCFAPYRTVHGKTRGEAFKYCTAVDEPPIRCRWRLPE